MAGVGGLPAISSGGTLLKTTTGLDTEGRGKIPRARTPRWGRPTGQMPDLVSWLLPGARVCVVEKDSEVEVGGGTTIDALSKYINNAENVKRHYFFFILRSLSACVPSLPSVIVSPIPISKSKKTAKVA